ncbi:MAG: hypothetical protein QOI34_1779 [Verrucomicrobiota bacterium]
MANHTSTRTTQLYDGHRDDIRLDEVERIHVFGARCNRRDGGLKLLYADVENQSMENKKPFEIIPGSPLHLEAQSLSLSVAAIRKAQGKKNPEDVPADSPEWHQVCQEFANDVLIVLGCDPEDMPEEFTAFELGYESEEAYQRALEEERRKRA